MKILWLVCFSVNYVLRQDHLSAILAFIHAEFEGAAAIWTGESLHFDGMPGSFIRSFIVCQIGAQAIFRSWADARHSGLP